ETACCSYADKNIVAPGIEPGTFSDRITLSLIPHNGKELLNISYQVAWPNGHGVSLTTRSEKVPGSIPGATMFLSVYVRIAGTYKVKSESKWVDFAWPNGHGVSLTIRSEKVPGSIPGATMFLVRTSC
ncbi:hypothetical protein N7465_004640, partial [Penicillium sp. CMV-2018d]